MTAHRFFSGFAITDHKEKKGKIPFSCHLCLLTNQFLVLHYGLIRHHPMQFYRDFVTLTFETGIIKSRCMRGAPQSDRIINILEYLIGERVGENSRKSLSSWTGVEHWVRKALGRQAGVIHYAFHVMSEEIVNELRGNLTLLLYSGAFNGRQKNTTAVGKRKGSTTNQLSSPSRSWYPLYPVNKKNC